MRRLIIIMLFAYASVGFAQKSALSGVVTDSENGETLVGATVVLVPDRQAGTITNENGFFSLPGVQVTEPEIEISFIGYQSKRIKIDLSKKNAFINIQLTPLRVELEQITIVEKRTDRIGDYQVEISQHTLTPKAIQSIPSARNDVFRALKYLPGIETTEPMSPLVSVRGSDPGENLIMLDGVTIYNPYHFMSSSGIFNMQTVKNVDMLVGGFGAEYGGRNSSVINIATKDGNNSQLHGEVQPTTAETKFFLEFPVSEKSTMMVAGRVNYDLIGNFLFYSSNYFYDANLSFTHRFSPKTRLTLKYFSSRDRTNLDFNNYYKYIGNTLGNEMQEIFDDMSLKWINHWNNNIATAIFNSAITPKLFMRAQVFGSFHSANNFTEMVMNFDDVVFDTSTRFKSKVNDVSGKISIDYKPFYWNEFKVGTEYNRYRFFNGSEVNRIENASADKSPNQISFFAEDKITLRGLIVRPGIRVTQFGAGEYLVEPRINAVVNLPGELKIQAAWGKYNQHIISMNTQEFEFNQFLDYYYPLGNGKPSQSTHYILGAEKALNTRNTLGIDIYYKDISRTYTFDLLQNQYEAFALSDKVVEGTGKTYGVELLWKGSIDQFSGWASYTLSKSTRSFPHIMNGETYDYDYDRRHSFKGVVNYQATKRISYSTAWKIQSGTPRSIENTLQMYYMYDPLTGTMIYSPQYTVNKKNATRMPWLFYLDFGLQKRVVSGFGKNLAEFFNADESYLTLNVYNALFFRRNVLYYFMAGLENYTYIPMGDNYLPTVSAGYTIKF